MNLQEADKLQDRTDSQLQQLLIGNYFLQIRVIMSILTVELDLDQLLCSDAMTAAETTAEAVTKEEPEYENNDKILE